MKVWNYFKTGRKFGIQAKRAKRLQLVEVPLTHNSPHPGEVMKELCLVPLDLTVTETAKGLGVSRKTLSAILNGKAGISPEMAVRLSFAFNTSSESWSNQQSQYDLWRAEQRRSELQVKRLSAA